LPGSDPVKDIEMAKVMFEDPRFQPDYLKVYPAMVIEGTELFRMWKRGEYQTYQEEDLKRVLKVVKELTPPWCRIDRLVRDISKKWVSSGTDKTNMRQILQEELKKEGKVCKCIRCREVRGGVYDTRVELLVDERQTLGGKEFFLSFESDGKLFSMLRLRLPDEGEKALFKELEGAAIIREVHTYGQVKEIEKNQKIEDQNREKDGEAEKSQHHGLGKKLMAKAEEIAKSRGYKNMAVISAIGTREYYRKNGYVLEGEYMVKVLLA
jgi:elongator complex protein 3